MAKLDFSKLHVMGILNVTPDSFSDGGLHNSLDNALFHTERMIAEGASIIDIGGESTRPGAQSVNDQEEIDRVIPILEKIKNQLDIFVSIDTSKPLVMQEAIKAKADMINDVRALQEEDALSVCAKADIPICLMHMQGKPRSMQHQPSYKHVVNDIKDFFKGRIQACEQAGITRDRLLLDLGFGFGKTLEHNVQLLSQLEDFSSFDLPLLVGISRKSMIGALLDDAPSDERLYGSISAAVIAVMKGAKIIRAHDVKANSDAIRIVEALKDKQ